MFHVFVKIARTYLGVVSYISEYCLKLKGQKYGGNTHINYTIADTHTQTHMHGKPQAHAHIYITHTATLNHFI